MNIVKNGLGGISVEVIADSVSKESGVRVTTLELIYPRFIHSELMTHRLFSRNAASSRAIPVKKMLELIENNPARPIHWGANQSGMQADNELEGFAKERVEALWYVAMKEALNTAYEMADLGAHKQIVNRILEPFQMMKTVVTATEFDNFFWLRRHSDSQPEIRELADTMYQAMKESKPFKLNVGEWHVPYITRSRNEDGAIEYYTGDVKVDTVTALKVSGSSCAQVSYRVLDTSVEKAELIFDKLINSSPIHASPVEHQAMVYKVNSATKGVTHIDKDGNAWSGNLKGFIQYRQMLDNNACWSYENA